MIDQQGKVLARSLGAHEDPLSQNIVNAIVAERARDWIERSTESGGPILITTLPFRVRMAGEPAGTSRDSSQVGRPRFKITQVALYLHGKGDVFRPLRQNLIISIISAIVLVASMVLAYLLWPKYMRGRHLEQQMVLARMVQREFLPRECKACEKIDYAAEFMPFMEVGGDYYDVFAAGDGKIHLVLGDVSGKGLPAAMMMGLLQGAVRSAAEMIPALGHTERIVKLNDLLLTHTEGSRFVSLFWGCFDRADGTLWYVNAGHLPPFLVRGATGTGGTVEKLEIGGPVLGLLPDSRFEEGRVALDEGDVLVLYSDGLTEAESLRGDEYGEDRLLNALRVLDRRSAADICHGLLADMKAFTGTQPLRDDLTLLVVRLAPPQ